MSTFHPPTDHLSTDALILQYHFTNTVYLLWLANHRQCLRELSNFPVIHDEERIEIVWRCLSRVSARGMGRLYLDWPAGWAVIKGTQEGPDRRVGWWCEGSRGCCFQHAYPELWEMEYADADGEA